MPNNTKKEECHCQRTDRLHRVDMKGFIKTWWHCLLRMHKGHRMCKYWYNDSRKNHWECDCGFNQITVDEIADSYNKVHPSTLFFEMIMKFLAKLTK